MNTKFLSFLLLATASISLTGCFSGRTSVTASHYDSRPYDIYLNGRQICRMSSDDDCSFQTRGTRAGGQLEAYLDGQRVGSIEVHRSISIATLLWAIPTYTAALWLYQAYPDEIEIPIDTYLIRNNNNSSNGETTSVWDRPYNSTKKAKKVEKPVESEAAPEQVDDAPYVETNDEPTAVRKSIWD